MMVAAVTALAPMVGLWGVSLLLRNVTIVDAYWGFGFVLVGWVTGCSVGFALSSYLLLGALSLWGLRLTIHLGARSFGHAEDRRYTAMRRKYQPFWLMSLSIVFLLQGALIWIVSLPVQVALSLPQDALSPAMVGGLALFAIGLFFESAADWQLKRFKANPDNQGRVLDTGVWRYSRHPNYFGDFAVWWGLFAMSFRDPSHLWTVIGPITMSVLLLRVSGVTLLESTITERRPAYREYQRVTSAFVPWPPKR